MKQSSSNNRRFINIVRLVVIVTMLFSIYIDLKFTNQIDFKQLGWSAWTLLMTYMIGDSERRFQITIHK